MLQDAECLETTATAAAAGVSPDLPLVLRGLHMLFDLDGDGGATVDELLNFSRHTEVDISTRKADNMLQGMDISGDQKVSWDEYAATRYKGMILSPEEWK